MENNSNLENIHIYLKSDKDKEFLKSISPYEKYIIVTNETLQSENRQLRLDNSTLSNKVETLEEISDKHESSITYMKGFLKNTVIMEQLSHKKSLEYKNIHNIYQDSINNYKKITIKHLRYLQAILLCIIGILYETQLFSIYQICFLSFIFMVFSAFHESTIKEINNIDIKTQLKNIKTFDDELNELKKGQDFLIEYIEIM